MAATRQDLITLVLENLGVLAAGQSASVEDRETVNRRIDPKLAELARREVIADLNADALDASVFLYVADVVAYACRTAFGITGAKAQDLTAAAQSAETMLKGMSRQFSPSAATAAFDIVRDVLERLGVVAPGQDPTAQDRGVVSARVAVLLADLRRREIIDLPSVEAADAGSRLHLAALLASRCGRLFGLPDAMLAGLKVDAAEAEAALRRISRQIDGGTAVSGSFDIVQSVLETLRIVEAGQTASTNDRAVVSARIAPMLADLKQREIIAVPSVASADPATQLHLAAILAQACAVPFGVPSEALEAAATRAEAALRALGRQFDGGVATSGTFDVIQAVLENLSVVVAGYTGSAKDRAVVSARIAPTLADLSLREVVGFASLDVVPPGALIHLSVVLTSACAQAFGVPVATRTLFAAEAVKAEASLRAIARQIDAGTATSGLYDPIQAVLEMLGIVSAGQTASEKDRAVVLARVQPKLLELYTRDICGVTDLSLLAPELQLAFTKCLAAECAPYFGEVAPARIGMMLAMVPAAEAALRYGSFVYDARPALRLERVWGRRRCGYVV